jgi:hypothetical protein
MREQVNIFQFLGEDGLDCGSLSFPCLAIVFSEA